MTAAQIAGGITIIVSFSQDNREVFDLSLPNHREYCARHGYNLQNIEEPYNAYIDTDRIRKNLAHYDVAVIMGADVVIQRVNCPLTQFVPKNGLAMCPQHGDGVLNGDFIIMKCSAETFAILDRLDAFQFQKSHGQEALNELYADKTMCISSAPFLQIAAPAMNPNVDYSTVDVSRYLSLHYHTMGVAPIPADKAAAMRVALRGQK